MYIFSNYNSSKCVFVTHFFTVDNAPTQLSSTSKPACRVSGLSKSRGAKSKQSNASVGAKPSGQQSIKDMFSKFAYSKGYVASPFITFQIHLPVCYHFFFILFKTFPYCAVLDQYFSLIYLT